MRMERGGRAHWPDPAHDWRMRLLTAALVSLALLTPATAMNRVGSAGIPSTSPLAGRSRVARSAATSPVSVAPNASALIMSRRPALRAVHAYPVRA